MASFYTCHAFTQRSFSTQQAFTQRPSYTQNGNIMHNILPCTTLSYKTCAKFFPVLHCTTSLAQSTSQDYFVLQSLRTVLSCTTLYYKTCTKECPVLLCTTKLAQSTSQYRRPFIFGSTLYLKAGRYNAICVAKTRPN